jgi:hypothetical protein
MQFSTGFEKSPSCCDDLILHSAKAVGPLKNILINIALLLKHDLNVIILQFERTIPISSRQNFTGDVCLWIRYILNKGLK